MLLQVALVDSTRGGSALPPDSATASAVAGMSATRARSSIRIDGILDDSAWIASAPISGFTQREPQENAAPTQRTVVRISFDDHALYVSAELFDSAPDSIISQLARRDNWVTSDRFMVMLDPYRDKRTGYYFGLNVAGTQYDGTLLNDDWDDDTWDGVWQSATRRTPQGWVAEMRIPYSQLRFRPGANQVWGINFRRDIARRNERDYIVFTPTNGSGFVSRFPELAGLDQLKPPRRLELVPYATARAEYISHDSEDPFNDGSVYEAGLGGDFRVGLGSNLTVNGTVNPDFGQVELDPAVVNLSDVEVFFPERRPFFVEGADLYNNFGSGGSNNFWGFNWAQHTFVYTRRVGRRPQGSTPEADYVDVPGGTRLLGAAKLSGRAGGNNIGLMTSLTRREYARVEAAGVESRTQVEPLTSWNALRLQRDFDGGRHAIGLISTVTQRFFNDDVLPNEMNRGAYTFGLDGWTFLDEKKVWVVTGWAGGSLVTGTRERMLSLQEGSTHYFQRPDAGHVEVDSAATSLTGWAGRLLVNKQKGPVQVNASFGMINPGLELNDQGFAPRSDIINSHFLTGYRWMKPTAWYQSARVNLAAFSAWDFGGNQTGAGLFHNGNIQFRSFWWLYWRLEGNPQTTNIRLTRGGPAMLNPSGMSGSIGFDSDSRKRVVFGANVYANRYRQGADNSWGVESYVEWRPMQQLQVSLGPQLFRNLDGAQYVGTFADSLAVNTFGNRYVFGDLAQWTLSANIRLNWIFTPRLSLELFMQPFVSSGEYRQIKELAAPRTFDFLRYGVDGGSSWDQGAGVVDPDGSGPAAPIEVGDPDFTVASVRGNAVLRWEWSPGSTVFLVWTHNRNNSDGSPEFDPGQSFNTLFQSPGDNVLQVKWTWWINP
jgi:hypothetical protein